MVCNILKIYLSTLITLFALSSIGQTSFEINSPNLSLENECLYITYNLNDKSSDCYDVWIEIVNSSGFKINAKALSGDIGANIKAGKNKSIIWDIPKDNIELNESISIKIIAELRQKQYNKGKLIMQSVICPGWGQTKLNKGKPYWLMGFAGVGCIAGSYLYNQQSVSTYNKYVNANSLQDEENFYNQAIQQENTSKILAYSAIGIWTANIIWMVLIPNKSGEKYSDQGLKLGLNSIYPGENYVYVSYVFNIKQK